MGKINKELIPSMLRDAAPEDYETVRAGLIQEVAHTLVNEYLDQDLHPSCFSPEKDNPYPLCIGNGQPECRKCCLYAEMDEEPWEK